MNSQGPSRFHRHHGTNIILDAERVTATRSTSFANALTFSEKVSSHSHILPCLNGCCTLYPGICNFEINEVNCEK